MLLTARAYEHHLGQRIEQQGVDVRGQKRADMLGTPGLRRLLRGEHAGAGVAHTVDFDIARPVGGDHLRIGGEVGLEFHYWTGAGRYIMKRCAQDGDEWPGWQHARCLCGRFF